MNLQLIEIGVDGRPAGLPPLSDLLQAVCVATHALYQREGYVPPWTGYLASRGGQIVGMCGFKSPPRDGRIEIAYSTLPEFEGQGIASSMARELTHIARTASPALQVVAQTLPEENASTSILKKLGFVRTGTVQHPEDGEVWEWSLPPSAG